MAEQNPNNMFRYTNLTYDNLKNKLDAILSGDDKFKNFVDSSLYKIIMNTFLGATDLTNYYIERTAEECFLDSAKHLSSVILGAEQIGYVPRRPTPARASISITLKGDDGRFWGDKEGCQISLPTYSVLKFGSIPFILKYGYVYTLTAEDIQILSNGGNKVFTDADVLGDIQSDERVPIEIMQGYLTYNIIEPESQAGQKFQKYTIDDTTFSDVYGDNDLAGGLVGENAENQHSANLTRVFATDAGGAIQREYAVSRRGLTTNRVVYEKIKGQITQAGETIDPIDICLIKTNPDTTVKVCFGDNSSVSIGAGENEKIRVEYLSTMGASANQVGVIGSKLKLGSNENFKINADNANAIPDDLFDISLTSNIYGGADFESKESIRNNAPQIYNSLDRLVTKADYESFLKTMTVPFPIKYGMAWGESEELEKLQKYSPENATNAIREMFNVAVVCAAGQIYSETDGNWSTKKVLTNNLTNPEYYNEDDYGQVVVGGYAGAQGTGGQEIADDHLLLFGLCYIFDLMDYNRQTPEASSEVTDFMKLVNDRSMVTIKNIYVSPIFQGFNLEGDIGVERFVNITDITPQIQNEILKYLNDHTGFGSPIYISDLVNVVTGISGVKYANLKFVPVVPSNDDGTPMYDYSSSTDLGRFITTDKVSGDVIGRLNEYLAVNAVNQTPNMSDINYSSDVYPSYSGRLIMKDIINNPSINVRSFYYSLCRKFTDANDDVKSQLMYIFKVFSQVFAYSLLDEFGNIKNFSMDCEIPVIYPKYSVTQGN